MTRPAPTLLDKHLRQAVLAPDPKLAFVADLLKRGANPGVIPSLDPKRLPLLVQAMLNRSSWPRPGLLSLLVDHGADLDTPLYFHSPHDELEVLPRKPLAWPWPHRAVQPLGLAAYLGMCWAIPELVRAGANPSHRADSGHSPLHLSVCAHGQVGLVARAKTVQALLDAGADPTLRNDDRRTPLECWMAQGSTAAGYSDPGVLAAGTQLLADTLAADPSLVEAAAALLAEDRVGYAIPTPLGTAWRQALAPIARAKHLGQALPASRAPTHRPRL